jgi:PAS domain S-box-containing protein
MTILHKFFIHYSGNTARRTFWYIRTRWLFLLAIAVPGVLSNWIGEGLSQQVQRDLFLGLLALSTNAIFYLLAKHGNNEKYFKRLAVTLLIMDIIIITILIFIKGGIESRSPILYTIPMLMASAIFSQRGVYGSAILSIALYNLLILGDWVGIIDTIGAVNPQLGSDGTYVINTITFFTSALAIIALLADFITRLLSEQQKQTKETLAALEEAQSIAKVGSWTWDIPTNKINWSAQLYKLYGFDPKKYTQSFPNYLKYTHPNDRKMIDEQIQKAIQTGESTSFDHRFSRDQKQHWLHTEVHVRLDDSGKPCVLFGTTQDITDRKQAEEFAQQQAKESEKLNRLMIGRELKMIELKDEIKRIKEASKS